MVCFAEWLHLEERSLVDPAVMDGYERAFQHGLEGLIQRTTDPRLRQALEAMRTFRFANYILGALVRHGIHQQYDVEDSLQRIVFRMLSPVGERGLTKESLFDLDPNRQYDTQRGNPLEARFRTYLTHELRNIGMGRIPALRRVQRPGSISIGYGRDQGMMSPDAIPGRATNDDPEMLDDVAELLRQRSTPDLDLVALFKSILRGEGTKAQRSSFGHNTADEGRKLIVQVIQQFAYRSQNWRLLRLLDRFRGFDATQADPRRPASPPKTSKPKYPPDEQDYRSIVDVLERSGRAVNMAVLGRMRRRWMERAPRDPSSPHPNRLADVLAQMVADGVLAKRGAKYVPGEQYAKYVAAQGPTAVA
jgi:hypothetical protein